MIALAFGWKVLIGLGVLATAIFLTCLWLGWRDSFGKPPKNGWGDD